MEKAGNRISFFYYVEAFCHASLLGLLTRAQRYGSLKQEDTTSSSSTVRRAAVRFSSDFPDMEAKALEALAQADARAYGDDLAGFTVTVYWLSS